MDSVAGRLAELNPDEREEALKNLSDDERAEVERSWRFWARPEQLLPDDAWNTAWISGGRGSGKTRAGAETAAEMTRRFPTVDGAIIAPTFKADAVRKCVEGASGLLRALGGEGGMAVRDWNRSEGVIYLRSGASIFVTGADNGAIRVQGENLGWAWMDEPGLWKRGTWQLAWEESIQFAVRLAPALRFVTGTPKAGHPLVKLLDKDPGVLRRRMATRDNIDNLDPDWVQKIIAKYGGTRLGAQELEGHVIEAVDGALWTWEIIENHRLDVAPAMVRIVTGVDPSGGANEIGIVAAGRIKSPCPCGKDDHRGPHYAVLDDVSLIASPERWGRAATDLHHKLRGDRVAAERNYGGEMVESTLRVADKSVPVKLVNASRGKTVRAEPVSALYEQGRVHHVGVFPELETEQTSWVDGDDWSPNRLDACVWAITELMTAPVPGKGATMNPAMQQLGTGGVR